MFVSLFFLLIFLIGAIFSDKHHVNHQVENDFFSPNARYSRDNLMEAYICLGARFIRADRQDSRQKIMYMNKYFNQYFPKAIYNFSDSLSASLREPASIKVVGRWLQYNLPQKERRLQVLYFLSGMSMIDGSIGTKEKQLLEELNGVLGLSKKDFESVMAMYQRREERSYEKSSGPSLSAEKRTIQLSCRILGISEHASMDEIKKAYRALAKIHHPDRFATDSIEQQEIANERFVEIQKAYDALEKLKF